jgi:hypothetical protein
MDEQTGTEEQFAMAYVLMARASGLPARLVSGYRPGTYDTNTHTVTVRSSDAYVWPEVSFTNIGWIAFNPVPASSAVPPPPPPLPALEELREAEPRHPTETAQPNADHDGDADGERSRSSLAVAGVASILVATIVVVAWRLPRMLRTRRRRRVDDATHRTRGAWHEVVDILEAHTSVRRSMTTEEIGLHLREFADLHDAVVDLGRLNERIVYADHTATATEAETSWQTVRTVRKLSRRRGTRVR